MNPSRRSSSDPANIPERIATCHSDWRKSLYTSWLILCGVALVSADQSEKFRAFACAEQLLEFRGALFHRRFIGGAGLHHGNRRELIGNLLTIMVQIIG